MGEQISWTISVQVADGPRISASNTIEVEAYDKMEVAIDGGTSKEVLVQPGNEDKVKFLLIACDEYSEDLTYTVVPTEGDGGGNGGTEGDAGIKLDSLLMLMGVGAVSLLDDSPKTLRLNNGLDHSVSVQILVGRDASIEAE